MDDQLECQEFYAELRQRKIDDAIELAVTGRCIWANRSFTEKGNDHG